MGKVATLKVFFDYLSNDRPLESIVPFLPLIVDLYKFLKVISDALIEGRFFEGSEDGICLVLLSFTVK